MCSAFACCLPLGLQVYDAYLYVQYVGGAAGLATPWDVLSLALSPVRSALARIHSCMPGFCRCGVFWQSSGVWEVDYHGLV